MDNLRGHFPEYEGPADDPYAGEDDADGDLPPAAIGQDERRMQVRAYNFWASLLDDRNFPAIGDLDPQNLPDFGPYSVLLDFTAGIENPAVAFLGDALAAECGAQGPIASLADVPSRSLLSRITDHYMQILANQAPIGFEAEFVNQRGATILYRGILLPFSSDNVTIDFIYGVINWKELADQKTTDELLLQIDQVLEPRAGRERAQAPLTEWADGPADLSRFAAHDPAPMVFPEPAFGDPAALGFEAVPDERDGSRGHDMALGDWLASARELALAAKGSEDRSRQALYAAIGRAYDFALAAAEEPHEFRELVEDAGLAVQDRAPLTPLVKLVFGADYDKTRLTEYAAAIGHAQRLGLAQGALAEFLAKAPGGLKGVVGEERRLRRIETGKAAASRHSPRDTLARKLRGMQPRALAELSGEGEEFTVLVARRLESGEVVLLGEVSGDTALVERAARRLLG
ncbi:PAS domain-containing protein [Novosphingobium album (ex Liu et al. 2023)]|uniref:PAS domain-containing protein n=1 Tax=Novosphingobium album (ex Liu et al. 2023) TaxID=3031130 RepID=A0ABT5WVB7_9SPHN|nr:hypothetical protein [Novosphingobium album (ex Liu et al. 2023)]MDE8653816.1 hypothetical protein [Novosphingobium album (ex Liu et al. 2023)]